jgi:hypothetical protein
MATDTEQITKLSHLYAEYVDHADFPALGRMFSLGAIECLLQGKPNGGRCRGSAEVAKWYEDSVAEYEGGPHTRHVITNLIVDVASDGLTASARSYFTVFQCLPDFPLQVIAAGRYHDRFSKVGGTWCFTEKLLHGDYTADISRHFRPLVDAAK